MRIEFLTKKLTKVRVILNSTQNKYIIIILNFEITKRFKNPQSPNKSRENTMVPLRKKK